MSLDTEKSVATDIKIQRMLDIEFGFPELCPRCHCVSRFVFAPGPFKVVEGMVQTEAICTSYYDESSKLPGCGKQIIRPMIEEVWKTLR